MRNWHAAAAVAALVALALAGCSDTPEPRRGAVVHVDIVVHDRGDSVRFVAGAFNRGDARMALAMDCSEWEATFVGPDGNVTLEREPCAGDVGIPPGGSASQAWTWETKRLYRQVGGRVDVTEWPVDGDYTLTVRFAAPHAPVEEVSVWRQRQVPADAVSTPGPGERGWVLRAWNASAALENRGASSIPVAWSPCGVPLRATDADGALLPAPPCSGSVGIFHVPPGRSIHAPVGGDGVAADVLLPAGKKGLVTVLREGDGGDAGRGWFSGPWYSFFGDPRPEQQADGSWLLPDPARPGVTLRTSGDPGLPWATVENHGDRSYRYPAGCGLPWREPREGCTEPIRLFWLDPGEDETLSGASSLEDGATYTFHWAGSAGPGTGDVMRHRVAPPAPGGS